MTRNTQVLMEALKEEMAGDDLPSLHRAHRQMSSECRILGMACKLLETLPQQLIGNRSRDSLPTKIFHLLTESLAPEKAFASVEECGVWEQQVERTAPVLAQAMQHAENPEKLR